MILKIWPELSTESRQKIFPRKQRKSPVRDRAPGRFSHSVFFALFLFTAAFFSCADKSGNDAKKIIEYGTREFENFAACAKIKPEKAWNMHYDFLKKKRGREPFFTKILYVCVGDDYLFSSHFDKMRRVSLSGVYVNSTTGETTFKKDNRKHKLQKRCDGYSKQRQTRLKNLSGPSMP